MDCRVNLIYLELAALHYRRGEEAFRDDLNFELSFVRCAHRRTQARTVRSWSLLNVWTLLKWVSWWVLWENVDSDLYFCSQFERSSFSRTGMYCHNLTRTQQGLHIWSLSTQGTWTPGTRHVSWLWNGYKRNTSSVTKGLVAVIQGRGDLPSETVEYCRWTFIVGEQLTPCWVQLQNSMWITISTIVKVRSPGSEAMPLPPGRHWQKAEDMA